MTRVAWLLILLASACTGCDDPAFRVHGPSMGDALPGAHLRWRCPECQCVIRCAPIAMGELNCPNCGGVGRHEDADQAEGTLVRLATGSAPQRWDLVAFTHRHQWMVKRVVGLPGEHLSLLDGDVFVNGTRLVKDWEAFRRVALTVHDDRFRRAKASRWVPIGPAWAPTSFGYQWRGSDTATALEYHHREPGLPHAPVHQLYDSYSYNPGLSRELHNTRDVTVCWELKLEGDARLEVRSAHGYSAMFRANAATLAGATLRLPPNQWWSCGFGSWDGHTHLEVNAVAATAVQDAPPTTDATPVPMFRFLAMGEGTIELRKLRVERDLYYYARPHRDQRQSWQLAADEYVLIGDNLPRSIDSRAVQLGPIAAEQLSPIRIVKP